MHPSAGIPTEVITEQGKVGRVRNRRRQSASFFTFLIPSYTQSFGVFEGRASVKSFFVSEENEKVGGYLRSSAN